MGLPPGLTVMVDGKVAAHAADLGKPLKVDVKTSIAVKTDDVPSVAARTAEPCAVGLGQDAQHCGVASGDADPQELQPTASTESTVDRQKTRLLVIRTNRCASTAFGGWILRAVYASHGRLEAYRADDGEVARTGVTAWAAHASAVLDRKDLGPFPPDYTPYPPMAHEEHTSGAVQDDAAATGSSPPTFIVAFLRSPPSQFASAYGSFKSSGMGHYGESLSDTLSRPPQPENWRLDNMNARSLGWGPLVTGAWDKKLTPAQERHGAGLPPEEFVAQVEKEVDLVLIVEHMVESLVMLRRALGLPASALHDNLAMLVGINGHLSKPPMSPDDAERVCSDTWSSVDCALFEHFNASLWARVEAGGEDVAEEVREVRQHWSTLDDCCEFNSCAQIEQIYACDRIRDSAKSASEFPTIVQFKSDDDDATSVEVADLVTWRWAKQDESWWVGPNGSDSNDGSAQRPFRTLPHALAAVSSFSGRRHRRVIAVYGGKYLLDRPLQLTAEHSGITIRAAGDGPVEISGGRPVTGWERMDQAKNIWRAPVPSELRTRQLWVEGRRANRTSTEHPSANDLSEEALGFVTAADQPLWSRPGQVEAVFTCPWNASGWAYGKWGTTPWDEPRCPVQAIERDDETNLTHIIMQQPCLRNARGRQNFTQGVRLPARWENVKEDLMPGEWFLDTEDEVLLYIPTSNTLNPQSLDIVVPRTERLLEVHGASDIGLIGLRFSHSTWLAPDSADGFVSMQAGYTIEGQEACTVCSRPPDQCGDVNITDCHSNWRPMLAAIALSNVSNSVITDCHFRHIGASALSIDGGSSNVSVSESTFSDISGGAIRLGGVASWEESHDSELHARNNLISNAAIEYHGAVGIQMGYVRNSSVEHNTLSDLHCACAPDRL